MSMIEIKPFNPSKLDSLSSDILIEILRSDREEKEQIESRLPKIKIKDYFNFLIDYWKKENSQSRGWLAYENSVPKAFMISTIHDIDPTSPMAIWMPLKFAYMSFFRSPTKNIQRILFNLYREAGRDLISRSYFYHYTSCFVLEEELMSLWTELGFGKISYNASVSPKDLPPIESSSSDLIIRKAMPEDCESLRRLIDYQDDWHHQFPIAYPLRKEGSRQAIYGKLEEEFDKPNYAHFVLEDNKEIVGVSDGFFLDDPPQMSTWYYPKPYAYLREAILLPKYQGHRLGHILCTHFYEWIREHPKISLLITDYNTSNPTGAYFWSRQGFKPFKCSLQRSFTLSGLAFE